MRDATCHSLSNTYHEQIAYIMMWKLEKGPFSTQARIDWAIKKRFHSRIFFSSFFQQYLLFGLQLNIFFFNLQLRKQDEADVRKKNLLIVGKINFPGFDSPSAIVCRRLRSIILLVLKIDFLRCQPCVAICRHRQFILRAFFFLCSYSSFFNRKSVLLKHLITFWYRNLSYCLRTRHERLYFIFLRCHRCEAIIHTSLLQFNFQIKSLPRIELEKKNSDDRAAQKGDPNLSLWNSHFKCVSVLFLVDIVEVACSQLPTDSDKIYTCLEW